MTHVDIAIIGSGSGNSLVTEDLKNHTFAIIDDGVFGGTCLNVGCIPTKMFVYAAEVANTIRDSARYGIDATLEAVRWADIRDRIFNRIDPISAGGLDYRQHGEPNTSAYVGTATFTGPNSLRIDGADGTTHLTADHIVIAAGSRADIPDVIAGSGVPFHTSDTIMRIEDLPARLLILGGGFIAAEFAHVFSAFGVEVTIVTRGPALLRVEDVDISEAFTALAAQQWTVELDAAITGARADADGVHLTSADGREFSGDMLLVATGRLPNGDRLDLAAAGVEHENHMVLVDEFGRTNVPGIWALGDVANAWQLKHVANLEARVVARNLSQVVGGDGDTSTFARLDHRFVPAAVFTHPQVASVGLTEDAARAAGYDVVTYRHNYGDVAYGWAMEDTTGFVKVVADRSTQTLLGAHILGPDASSLIQPVIQMMSLGNSIADVARGQYWIHPALAEVVENALLGLGFTED